MNLLTQTATQAGLSKKPNKKIAHAQLCTLIDELERKNVDLSADANCALQSMYKYFLAPTKTAKDKFDLLRMFRGNKDVRYYLNAIYSDGKRLTATDGCIAVRFPTDLEEGYYDDSLNKIELDGKFPNVDRVMPDISKRVKFGMAMDNTNVERVKGVDAITHVRKIPNDVGSVAFQTNYIEPLLKTGPVECYLDTSIEGRYFSNQAVAIRLTNPAYEGVEIVLMPVRT